MLNKCFQFTVHPTRIIEFSIIGIRRISFHLWQLEIIFRIYFPRCHYLCLDFYFNLMIAKYKYLFCTPNIYWLHLCWIHKHTYFPQALQNQLFHDWFHNVNILNQLPIFPIINPHFSSANFEVFLDYTTLSFSKFS